MPSPRSAFFRACIPFAAGCLLSGCALLGASSDAPGKSSRAETRARSTAYRGPVAHASWTPPARRSAPTMAPRRAGADPGLPRVASVEAEGPTPGLLLADETAFQPREAAGAREPTAVSGGRSPGVALAVLGLLWLGWAATRFAGPVDPR